MSRLPSRSSRLLVGAALVLAGTGAALGLAVVWELWGTDVVARRTVAPIVEQLEETPEADAPFDAYALLRVPRWGSVLAIAPGVGDDVLDAGLVGHYPDTAAPGGNGRFSLAAHRTTHGSAFKRIDELQSGDELIVETRDATYTYVVTGYEIVTPDRVDVVYAATDEREIVLTTCDPLYGQSHRWVVYGILQP